jgi:NAD(P)-dependent dehydrogenase (short-subunit alcohol dehydrogenase family)
MSDLRGKTVLITGVTSGIGRAAALEFAKTGAALVLGSRDDAKGDALAAAIRKEGGRAVFRRTDVTRQKDAQALVDTALKEFNRLDVAFNNAGLEATGALVDSTEETFDRVFEVNVKGIWWSIRAEIPALRRSGGGVIINTSSTAGSRGFANASIYTGSKHAVEGLSRAAALELAPEGIRVNVVAPGPTDTPMLGRFTGGKPEMMATRVPMGRLARPEEVARAVVFLASDDASFVSGVVLPVNGGMSAS